MVVVESELNSQTEMESKQEANKNHPFSSLGRQSSIYSLTLDEFQHTLCESGKNFGSMNMDEFLSSIWSAEENQNQAIINSNDNNNNIIINNNLSSIEKGMIRKQPSLPRQGSLTIPAPLCRKTVDEVWSEIHKGQQSQKQQQHQHQHQHQNVNNNNNVVNGQNSDTASRQPTFGEMTLEDFLVKAGVVREAYVNANAKANANTNAMHVQVSSSSSLQRRHQQHYGMYPNNNNIDTERPSFVMGGNVVVPHYQGGGAIGEAKRDGGYPPPGVCFNGGGGGVGGGGYGAAPVSPVSPEGIGGGENCGGGCQFGMEMNVLRGRKRVLDGPVEKVVERRQRRMIKNRESAARSRARKQAYTVELEAELNQLKEENAQLKLALADLERRRKQQYSEEVNVRVQTNAQKAKKKFRSLRRNLSCPL